MHIQETVYLSYVKFFEYLSVVGLCTYYSHPNRVKERLLDTILDTVFWKSDHWHGIPHRLCKFLNFVHYF